MNTSFLNSEHYFRVDRFHGVPPDVRDELVQRIAQTHVFLRTQPGFVRDELLVEAAASGDAVTIVTVVEWESSEVVGTVGPRVSEFHEGIGFDPGAFLKRYGITVERGAYRAARGLLAGSA